MCRVLGTYCNCGGAYTTSGHPPTIAFAVSISIDISFPASEYITCIPCTLCYENYKFSHGAIASFIILRSTTHNHQKATQNLPTIAKPTYAMV
ncbi:uncharacterized protein EURHEDRAFT_112368 [Aspergillus ruber CBS 135680]|uniref:Uncharacterized protein n=1 Tax=Aspergillus ruber (strain CBS 135680) TaxID=1388766 RepID=A0A017SA87_ASPRC|nr:uncharacterized protein EURHEDRAFT_112368 [Aspergillus ruber CBS 135680]EYE93862.1 hypothetical protein EURHEDRAFT_112368 [Aspergillus ruber CBS 135680]